MSRVKSGQVFVIALVAGLAAIPAPQAHAREIARGEVAAGPVLTPAGVVWGQLADKGMRIYLAPSGGGASRIVARVAELRPDTRPAPREGQNRPPAFVLRASERGLALTALTDNYTPESGDVTRGVEALYAARFGQPFRRLFRCDVELPSPEGGLHDFDVEANRLAYVKGRCERGPRSVVLRDLDTGESRHIEAPAPFEVALAGRFIAYRNIASQQGPGSSEIVVRDIEADREVYALRPGRHFGGAAGSEMHLQPDGKLAFEHSEFGGDDHCNGSRGRSDGVTGDGVSWMSPTEPQLHLVSACGALWGMGADRIAHSRLVTAGLSLTRVTGETETVPLGSKPILFREGAINFDGTRVAVVVPGCIRSRGRLRVFVASEPDPPVNADCPLLGLGSRRLAADRAGRVRIKPLCPNGCNVVARLQRGAAGRRHDINSGYVQREVAPGATLTLTLNRSTRRVLNRQGSLRARLVLETNPNLTDGPAKRSAYAVTLRTKR